MYFLEFYKDPSFTFPLGSLLLPGFLTAISMSSLRSIYFMYLALLSCLLLLLLLSVVLAMEENPQLVQKSVLKVPSTTSFRVVNKALLPRNEVAVDFSDNGTEEGGEGARKMRNLLRDNGGVKEHETGEEGSGSLHGKQSEVSEGADEKRAPGTMKVGLDVRHRLRPRSKRKGKGGGGGSGYAGGFVAFNADYHFPRQHPPRNN